MRIYFHALIIVSLFNVPAWADNGGTSLPPKHTDLGDIAKQSQTTPAPAFTVTLVTSCFGVNLRNVPFPLNLDAKVAMDLPLIPSGTGAAAAPVLHVEFPGKMTTGSAGNPQMPVVFNSVPNLLGRINGKSMVITLPGRAGRDASYTLDPNHPVRFTQLQAPGGPFGMPFAVDPDSPNPVPVAISAADVNTAAAADGSAITITAAFPGSLGNCGSYRSPLMLFFSDARPTLQNVSSFPLRSDGETFYWPEGSKDWAFLVYDKKGDGKIVSADQLFGSAELKNGFEALKALDSNHDKVITAKDKEFSKLKLWFDLNGDGKVDDGELKTLAEAKIDTLNLSYKIDRVADIGGRGEFREYGTAMSGKKSIVMIDVWFGIKKAKIDVQKANKGDGAPNAKGKKKT